MIIELKLNLNNNKILFSSWEIEENIWKNKSNQILNTVKKILILNETTSSNEFSQNNVIFTLKCDVKKFNHIRDELTKRILLIGGTKSIY